MDAIFKKDNVYVFVKDKEVRKDMDIENIEDLILAGKLGHDKNVLYGGRVSLSIPSYNYYGYLKYHDYCYLMLDGITIRLFEDSVLTNKISFEKVVACLNQIENLGVDSFLENYKLQLQKLKKELEDEIVNIKRELDVEHDEEKVDDVDFLKKIIRQISFIIFAILINMNAGLDNHCYTEAYDAIINLYF